MSQVDWFTQDLDAEADDMGRQSDDKRVRFLQAVAEATGWIAKHPTAGSPTYGDYWGIPGLKHKQVLPQSEFDYLAFYIIESSGTVRMLRLVHAKSAFRWKITMSMP